MRRENRDIDNVEVRIGRCLRALKINEAKLPRKASKDMILSPVPQTNTGGQEENSKVSERTMVKELGKMTP